MVTNSLFSVLKNNFDPYLGLIELSAISCRPNGMAWSTDNSSLFFSDGHSRNISKCSYKLVDPDVSNCETILTVIEELSASAVPMGIATDENDHIWAAVAHNDGKGAVLEIDPETSTIISKTSFTESLKNPRGSNPRISFRKQ